MSFPTVHSQFQRQQETEPPGRLCFKALHTYSAVHYTDLLFGKFTVPKDINLQLLCVRLLTLLAFFFIVV